MVEWHRKSRRKPSGGIKRTDRRSTKKLAWRGGTFSETRLAEKEQTVVVNGRGKSKKTQLRYAVNANVTDPSTKKIHKVKILNVLQNDANRQYARRNVITKGAVLEVELDGKKHVKVISRPGQQGVINAILIKSIETKKPKKKKLLRKVLSKTKPKKTKESKETKNENKKEELKESKEDKLEKKEPKEDELDKTEEKKEEPKKEDVKEPKQDELKKTEVKEEKVAEDKTEEAKKEVKENPEETKKEMLKDESKDEKKEEK